MKNSVSDNEFNMPGKETGSVALNAQEDTCTREYDPPGSEYGFPSPQEEKMDTSRRKRRNFLTVGAVVMTVVAIESANGYDLLGHDIFNDSASGYYEEDFPVDDMNGGENADKVFPRLSNLIPGGGADASRQYQEYMQVTYAGSVVYLYSLNRISVTSSDTELMNRYQGVSFDPDSNTLTLNHVQVPEASVIVNYMGNGFTIRLIGENELEHIETRGWGYGGSLTITGSGSLILNKEQTASSGIQIDAEFSETCLMIDSGVRLEVYGQENQGSVTSAIIVNNTSAEKGIYYLEPLTMYGAVRSDGYEIKDFADRASYFYLNGKDVDLGKMSEKELESESKRFHDFRLIDESGQGGSHVIFE